MREIKFRIWNPSGNNMLHDVDNVYACLAQQIAFDKTQPNRHFTEYNHRADGMDFMQFTGLKDKNEVEIYEGDIVTYKRSVGNWTGQFMTTTHDVIFSEEVFAFVMKYGSSYIKLRKHWGYEYEVIGNIYQTPELLNK